MKKRNKKWNEYFWGWFLVAPTIIGLIILNIIPIFETLRMSFFKSGDFGKNNIFVGLDNYKRLFEDTQVWQATWNTIQYTLLVVPITVIFALILATLLNSKLKGKHVYRTIYFLPMVAAPAAVTMVWKWLYNTDFGLINYLLKQIGLGPVNWVEDPTIAIYSIAIIGIWSTVGYSMILILAGLQEIPKDFYEAAKIDGASATKQFFHITLPLVSPTLFFVVVTSIIQAMQVFDSIYMMESVTSPAYDKTVSLVYLFYNNSFKYADKGYGSAIVMLLLAIILIITVIQMKAQKKWVNYM
ncbi:ABC transporter permease subunit [Granulicatella sp. zg-ZJ]|uniref:carbohydrate ABC transporter permease n=1 Tax=unclassified Granulicatella TaxID=2630493 RepID=UPI0013BF9935|nr:MULTISPECIES: sugar ABC transporter permease [unclassified Granulicatella]MBS4750496.1 sugar ABC transporter permease [Carnobacteriaceae bacterium zg-ZUI78]NEW62561.1 ABC transporter permease subunit [Granulicatella sp. zg-ZJ]NEW66109.1 ABC transporter permease subunit [Granulicatella sp. zg-84]QMI85450.1 sugar ABC transporter permease [Carnobacteriaceae bacterium zg-84]